MSESLVVAGGCFWGVEELIRQMPGVVDTSVGYTGGSLRNATYGDVKSGHTGHAEAVKIDFDPDRVSSREILELFFRLHDPTQKDRQMNDVGTQYRSAIFYADESQKEIAETVRSEVDASGKWSSPVVTQVEKLAEFWEAESYHQDYLQKNPRGYNCHFIRN